MVKTLRDDKGRYAGSIGTGKTHVPTPSTLLRTAAPVRQPTITPNIRQAKIPEELTPSLINWVKELSGTYYTDITPGYYEALEQIFSTAERTTYIWGPEYGNAPTRAEITHARQITGTRYIDIDPHYLNYLNKILDYTKQIVRDHTLAKNPQLAEDYTINGQAMLKQEIQQAEAKLNLLNNRLKAIEQLS